MSSSFQIEEVAFHLMIEVFEELILPEKFVTNLMLFYLSGGVGNFGGYFPLTGSYATSEFAG